MKNKNHSNRSVRLTCTGLAVALSLASPFCALAETEAQPGQGYEEYSTALADNVLEYNELTDRIKNYYPAIRSAYDQIGGMENDTLQTVTEMRISANDLADQKRELEDLKRDYPGLGSDLSGSIEILEESIDSLRGSAASAGSSISKGFASGRKSLDRSVNSLTKTLESLVNTYQQTLTQRDIAAKAVELSESALRMQQVMQSQNMAVSQDVLSAAAQLSSARDQLAAAENGLTTLKNNILMLTGYDVTADVQIGAIPEPDLSYIDTIDVNADKETAVGNNYDLISLRSSSASSGSTLDQVENATLKSTTKTRNKLRNVEYSENQVRSDLQNLYDTLMEQRILYDAACTAWQSGQNSWNAAQIQRQNGSLSQIQYQQMEIAYYQARSTYECARMSLQQAIRNYQWAVKGAM